MTLILLKKYCQRLCGKNTGNYGGNFVIIGDCLLLQLDMFGDGWVVELRSARLTNHVETTPRHLDKLGVLIFNFSFLIPNSQFLIPNYLTFAS